MKRTLLAGGALLSLFVVASCSGKKADGSELPHIDWSASIEKQTIDLNDYADFEYIPLETTDESVFAYAWGFGYNDSLIVMADFMGKRFLVFDREGKFIRSIDHSGSGPGEYAYMSNGVIDLDNDEIYVTVGSKNILTYDLEGNLKNSAVPADKLRLSDDTDNYDAEHFITWNTQDLQIQPLEENDKPFRYLLVNKKTGEHTGIPLSVAHPMGNSQSFPLGDNVTRTISLGLNPVVRSRDGFIISDFASDTLYEFANGHLTPIAVFDNIDRNRPIPDRVSVNFASGRYVGLEYTRILDVNSDDIVVDEDISGGYLLDRHTGKIIRYEMKRPYLREGDTDGNWMYAPTSGRANTFCLTLPTERLLDYLEDGKLRPEVEAVVKDLDAEDNPVLVITRFKE